ncbi:ImmA/IrrE family metallo-endopeptidase [Aquibium sp. ELW1220]|uniref:ImmA/IrrE family metallo-endopeptidase n=1 Tax=Aquibium sp. ELW1220 TaxID=2976766 RepID=UPI0025AFA1B0|nr:ImmA/IrrE family metallo-endopeptidase [Aquibium sp. ELW1220]MDN2584149.1 ImmA/IrrE family metallo-endopeptidase [Aquibium sp. ELW1220]
MSLPTTPKGWAIRLTQILSAVQGTHGLPRFPIDVATLAQDFSRQVFPNAPITMVDGLSLSKGVEGMLTPHPNGSGEWGIIFNETIRSPGRRNFTLAHELGHYLLHRHANPDGLTCTNRNMADWDQGRNRIEAEANTFASYLLMPLDDFRAQIKERTVDIDVMTALADRYAVSLTAAILKWLTITDKRAMIVVGKDGFIDWAWSSEPLIRTGIYYAARQSLIELPSGSLAAQEVDGETGRHGRVHPAGVWVGSEPVREMTVFSPTNEMTISLLIYPDRAPSRSELAELEEEPTPDTFDKFMGGKAVG